MTDLKRGLLTLQKPVLPRKYTFVNAFQLRDRTSFDYASEMTLN